LQLLSRPSQTSGDAWTFWLQTMPPPAQFVVPAEQTPDAPVEHESPPPGFPSSIWLSQSSSRPLQISVEGTQGGRHSYAPMSLSPGWGEFGTPLPS